MDLKKLRKEHKISQQTLADKLEVSVQTVKSWESGRRNLPKTKEMLIEAIFSSQSKPKEKSLPYYDIDATASQIEVFNDYVERPAYYMQLPSFQDCDFACNVSGDSMYPRFCSGDVIICKQITNMDYFQYGEPYLVITNADYDNMRTIKLIRKHKTDDDKIILKPSNPNFDESEITKDSIVKLYLIKGKINRAVM